MKNLHQSEGEPASAGTSSLGKANFGLYILIFFALWTVRATLLYPIDEAIQAQSPAWRQVYADTVRIVMWIAPVFVYLAVVDKVAPLQFLYLKTPIDRRGLLIGSAIAVLYLACGFALTYFLTGNGQPKQISIDVTSWQWYNILLGVPIAPLAEEILFRGFVLRKLQGLARFWPANLATAGLFMAIHWPYWLYSQSWNTGLIPASLSVFGFGLLLGYLVRKTNSLWPSIVTHMLNNFISMVVQVR